MQRVLSTLVSREVRDPRVGNVTITTVSVAPDMSTARIFFVPFASKHTPEEVTEGLNRASGFLRGALGRALSLRHAPKLEFVYDQQIENADKLTRLIDGAVKSDKHEPDADGSVGAHADRHHPARQAPGAHVERRAAARAPRVSAPQAPGTWALSIRWPPACCRCASTKPPRSSGPDRPKNRPIGAACETASSCSTSRKACRRTARFSAFARLIGPRAPAMSVRSIPWPPACCRCASTKPPRSSRRSSPAPNATNSRCSSARAPTPAMPKAGGRGAAGSASSMPLRSNRSHAVSRHASAGPAHVFGAQA